MELSPIAAALFWILAAMSLLLWLTLLACAANRIAFVPFVPRRAVPWKGADVMLVVGLVFVLQLLVGSLAAGNGGVVNLARAMAAFCVANLIAVAATAWFLAHSRGATRDDLGMPDSARTAAIDAGFGVLAFIAASLPVYLLQAVLSRVQDYDHPVLDMLSDATAWHWAVAVASAVVVAPIAEELFFRLILQGWLERLVAQATWKETNGEPFVSQADYEYEHELDANRPDAAVELQRAGDPHPIAGESANPYASPTAEPDPAPSSLEAGSSRRLASRPMTDHPPRVLATIGPIAITAFVFGMAHYGQGLAHIPLMLLGLILGYLYHRTHRITPCIVLHMLFNSFSLLILWLSM